jgi:rubrerythrin
MKEQIEKQAIDEMAKIIDDNHGFVVSSVLTAINLYNAGYRKQSEGDWVDANPNGAVYKFTCTLCGETKLGKGTPYCPNCGAHMKGGVE